MAFADHFSNVAAKYAAYRPRYPQELVDLLVAQSPAHALAWDAGCGNGQLSVPLAARFDRVIATAPAQAQLAAAERRGDLAARRRGFGAMRLPGKDVWGEPADPSAARAVLRRAIELGVNLIDTAWYYGPLVSNRLSAEALYPNPADLVIATKLDGKRLVDKSWAPALTPVELC